MNSKYQTALVVGGSRGIGKELALKLSASGVETHVVARAKADLETLLAQAPGIRTIARDASENGVAEELLSSVRPDLLILTIGATPKMAPFQVQSWNEFSVAWNVDVKTAHGFMSAALTQPMRPGGTLVSFSSGASLSGSRLSGGYAGAKRMQHFLIEYAQREADDLDLGLRFLSIIPRQLVQGTEKGSDAAAAYARVVDKPLDQFWTQWKNPLTAPDVASHVIELLRKPAPRSATSYAITGEGALELS